MPTERAVHAREADDDVAGPVLVDFEEIAVVDDAVDDVFDVVGLVGFGGDDGIERRVLRDRSGSFAGRARRVVAIVLRQVAQQLADHLQAFGVVVRRGSGATPLVELCVVAPPSVFLGDVFVGDGFDDVGSGDEHVAGLVDHEDEVGEGGGVDGSAGAGAHDGGDLRDDAAGERVAQEDIGVAAEREDAFLNARAAGIVEADDGGAGFEREVHDLDDLLGVGFRERAAEDGEVLREDVGRAAVDEAVAGDEAVAVDDLLVHAEIAAAVADEFVDFFEGAFVEQEVDAFAGGELAFFVLALAAFCAASCFGGGVAAAEFFEAVGHKRLA